MKTHPGIQTAVIRLFTRLLMYNILIIKTPGRFAPLVLDTEENSVTLPFLVESYLYIFFFISFFFYAAIKLHTTELTTHNSLTLTNTHLHSVTLSNSH